MAMIEEYFVTPIYRKQLDLNCSKIHEFCMKYKENFPKTVLRSNCGGYHSENLKDYVEKFSELRKLSDAIFTGMAEIRKKYKFSEEKFFVTNMWFNINHPKGYNHLHNHAGSFFSGVFYVTVPENSGNIIFKTPTGAGNFHYTSTGKNYFTRQVEIQSKANELILFPSWIDHYVEQNNSESDRISISFNTRID